MAKATFALYLSACLSSYSAVQGICVHLLYTNCAIRALHAISPHILHMQAGPLMLSTAQLPCQATPRPSLCSHTSQRCIRLPPIKVLDKVTLMWHGFSHELNKPVPAAESVHLLGGQLHTIRMPSWTLWYLSYSLWPLDVHIKLVA